MKVLIFSVVAALLAVSLADSLVKNRRPVFSSHLRKIMSLTDEDESNKDSDVVRNKEHENESEDEEEYEYEIPGKQQTARTSESVQPCSNNNYYVLQSVLDVVDSFIHIIDKLIDSKDQAVSPQSGWAVGDQMSKLKETIGKLGPESEA